MKSRHMILLFAATVFLPLKIASAFDFISQNIYGSFLDHDAYFAGGYGRYAGIRMPDGSSTPSLALSFIVPEYFIPGDRIRVGVAWHTDAPTPCYATLKPNFLSVARFGKEHIPNASASSGLEPEDGLDTLYAASENTTGLKIYEISSPDGVTSLKPFHVISFGLFRAPENPSDTCAGTLTIQGIGLLFGD